MMLDIILRSWYYEPSTLQYGWQRKMAKLGAKIY